MRSECLDHVIVLGASHLRRTVSKYASYYNEARTHPSLGKDAPIRRPTLLQSNLVLGKDSGRIRAGPDDGTPTAECLQGVGIASMLHKKAPSSRLIVEASVVFPLILFIFCLSS